MRRQPLLPLEVGRGRRPSLLGARAEVHATKLFGAHTVNRPECTVEIRCVAITNSRRDVLDLPIRVTYQNQGSSINPEAREILAEANSALLPEQSAQIFLVKTKYLTEFSQGQIMLLIMDCDPPSYCGHAPVKRILRVYHNPLQFVMPCCGS